MANNTIINLSKIKNNEMGIYLLISLVVIGIIYIPKQKKLLHLFKSKNFKSKDLSRLKVFGPIFACCGSSLIPGAPLLPTNIICGIEKTFSSTKDRIGFKALHKPEFCI